MRWSLVNWYRPSYFQSGQIYIYISVIITILITFSMVIKHQALIQSEMKGNKGGHWPWLAASTSLPCAVLYPTVPWVYIVNLTEKVCIYTDTEWPKGGRGRNKAQAADCTLSWKLAKRLGVYTIPSPAQQLRCKFLSLHLNDGIYGNMEAHSHYSCVWRDPISGCECRASIHSARADGAMSVQMYGCYRYLVGVKGAAKGRSTERLTGMLGTTIHDGCSWQADSTCQAKPENANQWGKAFWNDSLHTWVHAERTEVMGMSCQSWGRN